MFGRRNRVSDEYPEDIFDNSRMSFGDHIEQLRSRLLKAIYGLVFCLSIGFVLDYVGKQAGWEEMDEYDNLEEKS